MHETLRIEGDPVSWLLDGGDPEAVVRQLTETTAPIALPVVSPLLGRLILAPRALGSLVVLKPTIAGPGWVPTHLQAPVSRLYLPTAGGLGDDFGGYQLAPGTDLDALERRILAAIRDGEVLSLPVSDPPRQGTVLLYGASIRMAVLAPPTQPAP